MLRNPVKEAMTVVAIVIIATKGFIKFVKYYEKKNKSN